MTDLAQTALAAKRVGQYLIDAGVLTSAQLDEALDRQRRMSQAGFHVLLGTILEEMGAIDRQSLEAIILRQRLDEGSVNLGPEVDWSPFRPSSESDSASAEAATDLDLSPEQAAETIEAFFGEADASADSTTATADHEVAAEADVEVAAEADVDETATLESHSETESASFVLLDPTVTAEVEPTASEADVLELDNSEAEDWAGETAVFETAEVGAIAPVVDAPEAESEDEAPALESNETEASAEVETADEKSTNQDNGSESGKSWREEGLPRFPFFGRKSQRNNELAVVEPETVEEATPEPAPEMIAEAPVVTEAPVPAETNPVAETYDSTPETPALPSGSVDVGGFKFSRTNSGLSEGEVSAVIGQLMRRNRALEDQVREAKESLSHIDSMRRYGEQSVKAADTIAQQIREEAESHAVAIRDRAQQEARKIVNEARTKHDEVLRDLGAQAMEVMAEIAKEIEDHRALNDTFVERARALLTTNTVDSED